MNGDHPLNMPTRRFPRAAWSSEPDGQPKSGHASSPEHRGCLYRTMLWAQQTENDG